MRATTVILVLLLAVSLAAAQLLPGAQTGGITNGRGGLGRYLRHLEHRDQQGYYPYGNDFGQSAFYPYGQVAFFG